jgi:uncharacterized protein
MVGTLSSGQIDALLVSAPFARLGCHAEGQTYVVPVSFALDGDRLVGITTPGKKIDMMRKNPEVCLCIDDIQDLTDWKSAVVWGTFVELDGINAAAATGLMIDKYGPMFADIDSSSRMGRNVTPDRVDGQSMRPIVYAINITERTGRYEEPRPAGN